MGILRLGKVYGRDRLEAASTICVDHGFVRVQQISDLLKHGMDKRQAPIVTVVNAENVRGRPYYADR